MLHELQALLMEEDNPPEELPVAENSQDSALLEHVLHVSRRMSEERSLAPLLSYTIDQVLKLVDAERGFIVLKQPDSSLDFRVARDKDGNDITDGADEISHSILEDVVSKSEPLVLGNAMTDPRFGDMRSVMELRLRSIMCAPLITKNRTIGAIYVENRTIQGRFKIIDLAPLALLANQAAVAIENAALNDEVGVAYRHLRELDELKNKFIFLMAHEVNTPLTSVVAYVQLLERVLNNSSQAPHLSPDELWVGLDDSVNRLRSLMSEIILAFRILTGKIQLRPLPMNLSQVIYGVLDEFSDAIQERKLVITQEGFDQLPDATIDLNYFTIAMQHIIGNAIKYTQDSGKIRLSGSLTEEGIHLIIQDFGIGIPLEDQEKIFDFFHVTGQISNHSTSKVAFKGGGFGLGLPIAKGVIESHNGSLRIESPGRDENTCPGTICHILLPHPDTVEEDVV